jgi:Transposase IS4
MASNELDNDEVWAGPVFRDDESQELDYIVDEYLKDGIVTDGLVIEAPEEADVDPASNGENIPDSQELQKKPKATRNKTSYAQKKLLATLDLFLDPLYHDKFGDETVQIVGQVRECPREANGKRYRIEWKNEGRPLPSGLNRTWLSSYIPASKAVRDKLQVAIAAYSDIFVNAPEDHRKKSAAKKVSLPAKEGVQRANKSKLSTPVAYVHTGHQHAMATSASVRTSSTISSLSQSTIASPEVVAQKNRVTRSMETVESFSEDGDDLDEEDNMYLDDISDIEDYDSDGEEEETTAGNNGSGLEQFLKDLQWNFCVGKEVADREAPSPYIGPSGLKPNVAASFKDPFECLAVCGGLDFDLVCRLARNSNEYARKYLLANDRNNRLHGQPFANITTEEMYHFLGITLRISLSPLDWGGYDAYFSACNRKVLDRVIHGSDGFARHYMTLNRYKQIRAAFHPEDRCAGDAGDKCYQLRHAINTMNQAALNAKYLGENLTFDEGGIGSRHRLNPVRQYNKDKPQKFRVDFFIMACSQTYFIHHLDVYQGANASNVGIHRVARSLPTTQKAVINAALATGMHNEVHGARHIALDNRYQCPELAFLLREKFKIYSTGTCRQNRKGWNKSIFNLDKKDGRGTYKLAVDSNNKVLCCQWVDSKVVNVVSSILSYEITQVRRQVGSTKKSFTCPYIITKYQRNMLGVDKSDQMRAAGGGFAAKAHYQKWYKRAYFAILDMMTLNALIAWNLATRNASGRTIRTPLKRHEFLWYIAQAMLDYQESATVTVDCASETTSKSVNISTDGHVPMACTDSYTRCVVCRLDYNTDRKARRNNRRDNQDDGDTADRPEKQSQKNMTNKLATCSKCRITAHATMPPVPRLIHSIDAFKGLTCFQIAHTEEGLEVWRRADSKDSSKVYYPQMKHPICKELRRLHGLDPQQARKRKRAKDKDDDNISNSSVNSTT